jgi:hypothetical protein
MIALVAILWALYVSECFTRWKAGEWVFRRRLSGEVRAIDAADFTLLGDRVSFAWTSLLPWDVCLVFSGEDLDREAFRQRLYALHRGTRWLRVSAATLGIVLLVVAPLLVVTGRLMPWLTIVLCALAAAWFSTCVAFVVTYRRLYGGRPPIEIWLVLALSPIDLIRAPFVVSLRALSGTHPVVAADALCGDAEFLRVARLWHFDARGLRPAIEALAQARDLGEALAAGPADSEPGVSLFCPRCHATFTPVAERCADCAVELAALVSAPSDPPRPSAPPPSPSPPGRHWLPSA